MGVWENLIKLCKHSLVALCSYGISGSPKLLFVFLTLYTNMVHFFVMMTTMTFSLYGLHVLCNFTFNTCFPWVSMFPENKLRETLRFEGNKIHCSPSDQSLHVSDLLCSKTNGKTKFEKCAGIPATTWGHLQLQALIMCNSRTVVNISWVIGDRWLWLKVGRGRGTWDARTRRDVGLGDAGTWGRGDVGLGDAGTWDSGTPGTPGLGTRDSGTRDLRDSKTW